ncbi:anti-phage-associated DUF1156 domain-containing protein [Chloroflexota bacterium]
MNEPEIQLLFGINESVKTEFKDTPCFMETQFPVSKLSKESYTERKAVGGQTLTGLGKWWGRKPLVICRAIILGLLLPATDSPAKDREIFLRLMTMDDDGMLLRKSKKISASELFRRLGPSDQSSYFTPESSESNATMRNDISRDAKEELQQSVFLSMSYDERLDYCVRPEQIDGPSSESWKLINSHLGTHSETISDLVAELGARRFGRIPRVGDAFCGGGSVPFEAARLGCEAYGSDLNPVAALLTWASLNIISGGETVAEQVQQAQLDVYEAVTKQVTEWDIECREPDKKTGRRWRADAFLYCVEATCPECDWRVPLIPSGVIAEKTNVIVRLIPDEQKKRFDFEIIENVTGNEIALARNGTIRDSELICPHCLATHPEKARTPIKVLRGDRRGTFGANRSLLRGWENKDVIPREHDIFGERLYCIRWIDSWIGSDGKVKSQRYYLAPTEYDLERECKVLTLLLDRFDEWQKKGFIPSRRIESGDKTDEPVRTRGWTYWHHLFTPRQLLINGLFASLANSAPNILLLGRMVNANSRLSRWKPSNGGGIGGGVDVFSNQALNTLYNYSYRPVNSLKTLLFTGHGGSKILKSSQIQACDARDIKESCNIWITDPPYADAIKYEEISEFFLAWYEQHIPKIFSEWYVDSKRALAVKGNDENFRYSMVDCYCTLAEHMPDNGVQVVMFTHQDAGVWADLTLILWAAGLKVAAAWCIATETTSLLKQGNYVQGTILMVLHKQKLEETTFLDEVYPQVETEVRYQLDSMFQMDEASEPNFSDTDYQLAAYAAALRVLTSKKIEEIDVAYEITRTRPRGAISPVEQVIRNAVTIACDHLVPKGMERYLWKSLSAHERFYLKGLEMESHGEYRVGVYQELSRGFGLTEYTSLLASAQANQARLKTATEFGRRNLEGEGFADTLLRQILFGIFKTAETESPREAITWLMSEINDYAGNRTSIIELLEYISKMHINTSLVHWHKDAEAAGILAGALRNRQDNV